MFVRAIAIAGVLAAAPSIIGGALADPMNADMARRFVAGDEPLDVINYGKAHPAFPHESTADQWFNEAQFESYRMLGYHSIVRIAAGYRGAGKVSEFFQWAVERDASRAQAFQDGARRLPRLGAG